MNGIETDEELEQLIDRLTMQLASDEDVDLETLIHEHPQHEQRLRLVFPAMCGMAQLSRQATDEGRRGDRFRTAERDSDERSLPAIGDYEILGEIGRGGMGVVYRARERTLHREVALKVLPLAALADRRQLARFHNETRAAAALHHSHIVPIYSVGVERGIHYYAMQYIAGPTLAEVLTELRGRDGLSPGSETAPTEQPTGEHEATSGSSSPTSDASTEPLGKIQTSIAARRSSSPSNYYRTVARWGIQVAEALAHAHEHGVVHRDIKPANLLLEDVDNIWVTDFGLARLDVGTTMTGSGDLLGTLRYMSPEQVAGHGDADGSSHRRVLVGGHALRGADAATGFCRTVPQRLAATDRDEGSAVLRDVSMSTIPVDLETIVLKAMEKDRSERYDTAGELADDLKRFVENHPIQARRASLVQRLRKWAKRHVGLVLVGVLALMLVSVTAFLAAVLIWRANEATKSALADRDAALQRAHEKATLAMIAVDEMYDGVATRWIANDAELTTLQREFLDQAVEIYEQIAQETANDRFSRKEVAYAWQRISDIRYATGQWKESLESAERSILAFDGLLQADPDNVDLLYALGPLYSNSSILMMRSNRMEEADAAIRKAAAVFQRLVNLEPEDKQHRLSLANTELNRSQLLWYLGQLEDAEPPARRAWQQAQQLASENDNQDWMFSDVAFNSAGNLSNLLQEMGRDGEAEQVSRQAVAECESLALDRPEDRRGAAHAGKAAWTTRIDSRRLGKIAGRRGGHPLKPRRAGKVAALWGFTFPTLPSVIAGRSRGGRVPGARTDPFSCTSAEHSRQAIAQTRQER